MKHLRNILLILLAVLLLPLPARAAEGTITVEYTRDGVPFSNVAFSIYRVADSYTDAQAAYAGVVTAGQAPSATVVTDERGEAEFAGLEDGTYLLVGQSHTVDDEVFEIEMSLVRLPGPDGVSAVTVQPKFSVKEADKPVTYRVVVIWEGEEDDPRPESVTIWIYRDEDPGEPVILTEEDNWTYEWEEPDPSVKIVVVEDTPTGFEEEYDRDGNTFFVINTPDSETPTEPTEPDEPKLPQTGQLWWPVPLLTFAGMVFLLLGWMRRKEQNYEA